jgi:WhiB family redox-sensing transcriptional regulator
MTNYVETIDPAAMCPLEAAERPIGAIGNSGSIMFDYLSEETREELRILFTGQSEPLEEAVWQDQALCAETDPDVFYPEKGQNDMMRAARTLCRLCNVRQACLEYAIEHNERLGIWGNTTFAERNRLRQKC